MVTMTITGSTPGEVADLLIELVGMVPMNGVDYGWHDDDVDGGVDDGIDDDEERMF
jgi:hypothetical protein